MSYDPKRLPERIDFHKATADLFLTREAKTKLQIQLSQMSKKAIKKAIKSFEQLEMDALKSPRLQRQWAGVRDRLIKNNEIGERLRSELFSEDEKLQVANAIYCRSCRDYAQKYLYSLEKQKKI